MEWSLGTYEDQRFFPFYIKQQVFLISFYGIKFWIYLKFLMNVRRWWWDE